MQIDSRANLRTQNRKKELVRTRIEHRTNDQRCFANTPRERRHKEDSNLSLLFANRPKTLRRVKNEFVSSLLAIVTALDVCSCSVQIS